MTGSFCFSTASPRREEPGSDPGRCSRPRSGSGPSNAWLETALRYEQQGRWDEAAALLEQGLGQVAGAASPLLTARLQLALGRVRQCQGDEPAALALFTAAGQAARELGQPALQAESLLGLGQILESCQTPGPDYDPARALTHYQAAETQASLARAPGLQAASLYRQGRLLECSPAAGAAAAERYRRALALAEAAGDEAAMIEPLTRLGLLAERQGRADEALALLRRTLTLQQTTGATHALPATQRQVGRLLQRQGDSSGALRHFRQSVRLAESQGPGCAIPLGLAAIADLMREQGDYGSALVYYERAREAAATQGLTGRLPATILNRQGVTYLARAEYEAAVEAFEQSLAELGRAGNAAPRGHNYAYLALARLELGEFEAALGAILADLEETRRTGRAAEPGRSLLAMGRLLTRLLSGPAEALVGLDALLAAVQGASGLALAPAAYFEAAIGAARDEADPAALAAAFSAYGEHLLNSGQPERAAARLRAAAATAREANLPGELQALERLSRRLGLDLPELAVEPGGPTYRPPFIF